MAPNKKINSSKKKSNKTMFFAIGIIAIILIGIGAYVMLGQSADQPSLTNANPNLQAPSTPVTPTTSPIAVS